MMNVIISNPCTWEGMINRVELMLYKDKRRKLNLKMMKLKTKIYRIGNIRMVKV